MSDGDDEPDAADETAVDVTPDGLHERLDEVETALEAAETEADLDDIEADLDDIETKLDAASLPAPDDDDDPREELEGRVSDLGDDLAAQRGPYASDVVETLDDAGTTVTDTEWTEDGETEAAAAVETLLDSATTTLDADLAAADEFPADYIDALDAAGEAIEAADLDADADADTIADLVEAADALTADLDDAEEWDDLSVVEQLTAQGFYDRLNSRNRKDFPPELGVVRIAEQENDPDRILLALESLESEFMQEKCIEAFRRMGSPEAYDAMLGLAERRERPAIEVLGKIGNDDACETLHEFIQDDSNPVLQRTVLKALGEIGSQASTQPVANRLAADDPEVRSRAARALGRIGDARAVDPLADVLADDSEDSVRAAAAWALCRIGTERALEEAAAYADDRSFIVQTEAETAAEWLDAAAPTA
jgi:hypothetical protein